MREAGPLRVLAFTTLFPNRFRPGHGTFVQNRIQRVAGFCDLRVAAPIDLLRAPEALWRNARGETCDGLRVWHPRFALIPGLFKRWDGELLFRQTLRSIKSWLRDWEPDVVDAHYAYPDGYAALRLARDLGKPFVLTIRGSDLHVLSRFPDRRKRIRRALIEAKAVVAVSSDLARAAAALGAAPERIRVVPNGVDTAMFCPRERMAAREALGLPRDGAIILSVGRLARVKGFDLLVGAVKALRGKTAEPLRCFIVGDGELRGHLSKIIAGLGLAREIVLMGWTRPSDLPNWYSAADVFCLLSSSEGCPNVVVESLACGTPVVGAAVGGIPEMVRDGEDGFLVRERTVEKAALQLERALKRRWDRGRIASSGVVRDWQEVARDHLAVLAAAAGRDPVPECQTWPCSPSSPDVETPGRGKGV